jgi:hypothetical protein
VAHLCNPSYLGDSNQEDSGFEANLGKKIRETPSQPVAGCGGICLKPQLCNKHKQEDYSPGWTGQKCESLLQK